MARVLRGEIRWARLGAARGADQERPVLVLSADVFNERTGTTIIAAVTSEEPRAGFPLSQPLSSRSLPRKSWVAISHVRTVPTDRIGDRVGRASPEELALVLNGLREILGD